MDELKPPGGLGVSMPVCPVCGGISDFAKNLPAAKVFICGSCGMVHASGIEQGQSSCGVVETDPDYFERTLSHFDSQCAVAREIVPRRLAAYRDLLGRPVRSILEIGPGCGAYARAYDEQGIRYTAIEIEPSVGELTRKRTGLDIRIGDFLDLDVGTDYDVVFASQVFEHILKPLDFLNRCRVVSGGGLLHLDVPNHDSLMSHLRKRI